MNSKFYEIMEMWSRELKDFPGQRRGQALFNAVARCDAETAGLLSSTMSNPFYNDALIPEAISWLAERYAE